MPRPLRSALPDGTFHVTCRGTRRTSIFADDRDRATFLSLLGKAVARHDWICHAYCLMPNHYHLVLDARSEQLSRGMQQLNGGYARHFNDRHEHGGHLFEGRFRAAPIESDEHLAAAREYVLANPVRAGLCASVADWPWSGCPSLVSGRS